MKRVRVNSRNRERYERNWRRAFGSDERVAWVKRQRCVAHGGCKGEMENSHVVGGGMGRRADAKHIVPMCQHHHRQFHSHGRPWFERYYGVDLEQRAAATEAQWQEEVAA
jgi:hypothetical protein